MHESLNKNYLLILAGPTASGKTDMAVKLAEYFKTEIISADSRQMYRELNIGTAKPDTATLEKIKHHFINNLSIHDYYNASMYEEQVLEALSQLFKNNKYVVMAGGSGLYIDAVCSGIDSYPEADKQLRLELEENYQREGLPYLRNLLKKYDPEYYSRVDLRNPKRMMKGIEISMISGKPYSEYLTAQKKKRDFEIIRMALNMPRDILYERINQRCDDMLAKGLLSEVEEMEPMKHMNALNTVGYKEFFEHKEGEYPLEEAIRLFKRNTRRYARRQITWFNRSNDYTWFQPLETETIIQYILKNSRA